MFQRWYENTKKTLPIKKDKCMPHETVGYIFRNKSAQFIGMAQ